MPARTPRPETNAATPSTPRWRRTLAGLALAAAAAFTFALLPVPTGSSAHAESGAHRNPPPPPAVVAPDLADPR